LDTGAADNRNLTDYGATQLRGLFSDATKDTKSLADYGATGIKSLADYGSTSQKSLSDSQADAGAKISTDKAASDFGVNNWATNNQLNLRNTNASDARDIADSTAGNKLSAFTTDTQRQLSMLNANNVLLDSTMASLKNIEAYKQSGLTNTMNLLNWFKTDQTAAPSTQTYIQQPNTTMGDALSSIGGGIANIGMNIGLAKMMKNGTPATPSKIPTGTPSKIPTGTPSKIPTGTPSGWDGTGVDPSL